MRSLAALRRPASLVTMALAAVLATFAITLTTPEAAEASHCGSVWHGVNGEGGGYMKGTYNLKYAPYQDCNNVASVPTGTLVYFHCFYRNAEGNLWVWVRPSGSSTEGWMSYSNIDDIHLDDNGDGYEDRRWC